VSCGGQPVPPELYGPRARLTRRLGVARPGDMAALSLAERASALASRATLECELNVYLARPNRAGHVGSPTGFSAGAEY
jgi:hypothetical protein